MIFKFLQYVTFASVLQQNIIVAQCALPVEIVAEYYSQTITFTKKEIKSKNIFLCKQCVTANSVLFFKKHIQQNSQEVYSSNPNICTPT